MSQHDELHDELDVYHAAPAMLDIEKSAVTGMPVNHLLAHSEDFLPQGCQVARLAKHLQADAFELGANLRIPGAETGARQGLMLPYPGVLLLVFGKCRNRAYQQAARAIRAQAQIGFI